MSAGMNTDDAIGRSAMNNALWRIIPLILTAYLFAYVDRVTVGFATATMKAYLAFSTLAFAVSMLISSAWSEALHVCELAVGAAAINTMSQIGACVTPFAWGAAKDATGNFDAGLIGITLMMVANAALILLLRAQLRGSNQIRKVEMLTSS